MKKLAWWFRIVGIWYLLLTLMNIYMMFWGSQQYLIGTFPFAADEWVVRAFIDGWSPFLFEMVGIGTFALWASRKPAKYASAALLLVWLEFTHGVLDDIFLIFRGYGAGGYIAFIAIHLIIIVTGFVFARAALSETVPDPVQFGMAD